MSESLLKTTGGQDIPLLGAHVSGEVVAGHTRVKLKQRYKNSEPKAIEAVYTFPLPSDASVCGFAMVCEGRRMQGVVREREEAFKAYDDAITRGHGAALLDQERKNVFTANVGNLLPNEETVIEIEYVQRLTVDEGSLRWMLPTLVAPRYIPGTPQGHRTGGGRAEPTDQVPDADRITPQIADVKYGLRLDLTFDFGTELELESPSHAIAVTHKDGRAHVSFEQREVALDRDVVIIARGAKGAIAGIAAHRDGEEPGFFALTVVPDLFDAVEAQERQEVAFVIDTSGSMAGESLPQAKAALKLCLRHLRQGDRFSIIAFSDRMRRFAPGPTTFMQSSLTKADQWVDDLDADGGTELMAPLVEAVKLAPSGLVILLTDGQVGNEDAILEAVLAERKSTRVATFGIGTNVSDQLLRDLARQTGGLVEFIHPGERIDVKVTSQFAKALAPRVTDVKLETPGLEVVELAPSNLPPLVDGEPWVVFGRYLGGSSGAARVSGLRNGQPFSLELAITLPGKAECSSLRSFWAKERITDLEMTSLSGRRADAMKERIIKLATEFGVASKYTSFVVIEERTGDRLANAIPETRFVPVAAPAGWTMSMPLLPGQSIGPHQQIKMINGVPHVVAKAPSSTAAQAVVISRPVFIDRRVTPSPAQPPPRPAARAYESVPLYSAAVEADEVAEEEADPNDPLQIFSRQLASGLWEPSGGFTDKALVFKETLRVLQLLASQGITSTHMMYGVPVKKAIDALLAQVPTIAKSDRALAERALAVCWFSGFGGRTRRAIEAAAAKAGLTLPDEPTMRQRAAGAP